MARRDEAEGAHDATRREFFRNFGRQTARNAGTVLGAAAELRRVSEEATRGLLEKPSDVVADERGADLPQPSFVSAYRLTDDALLILDQRDLPGRLNVIACREPTEVASAIRLGAVTGGPVLGEVCAYALAIVARGAAQLDARARDDRLRAAANTLRGSRSDVHALVTAIARLEARYEAVVADSPAADGVAVADALRAEADALATEAQLSHAALGRAGAEAISAAAAADETRIPSEPINLLMHGDAGPLSCGMVGTGTAVLQSLVGMGRKVHVWLTEAAPSLEGARVAGLGLTQLDVPHTLIADTAVGWLLGSRRLDGALLRGDTVCANSDTLAIVGSLSVAELCGARGVPAYVLAPRTAFDAQAADGRRLVRDLRSPAEAMAASVGSDGHARPAVFGVRLNPTTDVVPADLVAAFLTEDGPRPGMRPGTLPGTRP